MVVSCKSGVVVEVEVEDAGGAGDLPDEDVEVLHRPDPPSGVGEGYRGGVRGGGANISVHCRKLLVYQLN